MMRGELMNKKHKEAYVEVLEVLKYMDFKYVEKIPVKLRKFFYDNASKQYKFELNPRIPFNEQVLSETTINILAMLNYNYWCEDEEHRKYLLNKYNENEMQHQKMLMEKYSVDKIFERESKTISDVQNNIPQKYEEPKWYISIFKFIKKLFNRE